MSEESTGSTAEAPGEAAAYHEENLGVPSVRSAPTDQELIVRYLGRKLRNEPLPTGLVVHDRDAYAEHPQKLVPKLGEGVGGAWYLFSPRYRKYAGGMQPRRETSDGEGRWKSVGTEKKVLGGADGKEIGAKRVLTFHEHSHQVNALGKRKAVYYSMSKPTKWKMVEFVSINSSRAARDDTAHPMLLNECVLCKITNKSLRAAKPDPAQGDEEENDDDNGEEEPAPDGGGESQEKRLPEQRSAGGGGGEAQGEQQHPPLDGCAWSHGNRQPAAPEAPSWGHIAALPEDDYRGAKYFVGVDGSNRSGTNRLSMFGSDDHIGAFYGGGVGSHGNRQPATAEAPHGPHMATLPSDDYRGAKYFVGVDGSNRYGTNRLSVFGSDDHIGAFYGGGVGSDGNRQPATAEAPHGPHMAALPSDDYRGAKYFVGVDGSNRSGTNRLSVFGSDDHIGAFYGGGAGSHGNWQPATDEAPHGQHMAALPGDDYRSAKYFVGVDAWKRSDTNRLNVFGSDDHIGAFYGGGTGSHGNRQPATAEAPHGQYMAALPGDDYRGAKYFVSVDAWNRSDTNRLSVFGSDDHIGAFFGGGDSLGTQRAGHRQEASGGGAGSSPDEQQQPTPEAPNGGGAAATGAASQ